MFPSFLTGKELFQFFESKMNLFNMCLLVIAKPDVIKMHASQLQELPYNVKTAIFSILSKRGYLNDVRIIQQLVNPDIIEVDLSESIVTDEMLTYIVSCKNLRKLDLSLRRRQTRSISTKMLKSLFPYLPHLNIIAIPHCKELTDEVIDAICHNCLELRELHIPNSSITDHSLQIIGKHLHYLTVINLLGSQISDAGIEDLIKGPLSKCLSEINIDKCLNVTPKSSRMIDELCPNIKIFTCGAFGLNEESGLAMNGIRSKAKQVFWSV